jgi:murein DD-endopeptidase MepM/ murein hydrolase activator NlpD
MKGAFTTVAVQGTSLEEKMRSFSSFILSIFMAGLLLSGCGRLITQPTPTAVAIVQDAPTVTPHPTSTPVPWTPAPTATPTPTPTPIIYIVQAGDNLLGIAIQYGVTVEAIQEANAITDPRLLQIGQELVIPHEEEGLANPTPTPTPLPFQIANVGFYETPVGSLWCLGEVINNTGADIEQVQVAVSLYDGKGEMVATGSTFTEFDIIPNESKIPFALLFTEPPSSFSHHQVVALSGVTVAHWGRNYMDLTIESDHGEASGELAYVVTGQVRNTGQHDAEQIRIVVTAYDAEGRVMGIRRGGPETQTLGVDESSPFRVSLSPLGGQVVTYTVQVQGRWIE